MKNLNPSTLTQATLVFARGFFHDPLYGWFFPSEKTRLKKIASLYRFLLSVGSHQVWVFSDLLEGIAIWQSPYDAGTIDGLRWFLEGIRFVCSVGPGDLCRMVRFTLATRRFQSEEMKRGFFLIALVVDPPCQGKGIGSRMLSFLLKEADGRTLPVYLETENPSNIPLYERFGFSVVIRERIAGLEYVMMKRWPEGKTELAGDNTYKHIII